MEPAQGSAAYERLVAAAAVLKVPDAVLAVATATPQDPEPGQIWRAVWEDIVQLLVITAVDDDTVQTIAVSLERYADEDTLVLPAEASTLEQPLSLWWGMRQTLPWHVLDRQVSRLLVPLAAFTPPDVPHGLPPGTRWGRAEPSPAAAVAEYRGMLTDRLNTFRTARWAPEGSGGLPDLLGWHNITARMLAAELDLAPAQALLVRRGQSPLTTDQADKLAVLLGLDTDEVLKASPAPPPAVVRELNRPRHRAQVRALAVLHLETETAARHRAAYGVFALAARQEDPARADWAARADRYFELHLG